jgi:hypothetical protein
MLLHHQKITFEDGLIITCLFPRFSALYMLLRASFKTLTLTILGEPAEVCTTPPPDL